MPETARQQFLTLRVACPQCRAPRVAALEGQDEAHFECGGHFSLTQETGFSVVYPCPSRALMTAHLWNIETKEVR
ncbi:hypothetical protein [Rhizobium sp. SGZ-381]|uniref:hypothetical protein n=1 Tax=Rhizobium sp. SGZ-381 TaxID=3342800 RepID=UPI00366F446F